MADFYEEEEGQPPRDRYRREREPGRYENGTIQWFQSQDLKRKADFDGGDNYVPNYDRDGYVPAPRHSRPRGSDGFGSGYNSMPRDPHKMDHLASFREFADWEKYINPRRFIDDDEMYRRYSGYKENFQHKQCKLFFEEHKNQEWFKLRYHPEESLALKAAIAKRKRECLALFKEKLGQGLFDSVDFNEKEAPPSANEDLEAAIEAAASGVETSTVDLLAPTAFPCLFLKSVPISISRASLEKECEKCPGFKYLVLSDPSPFRNYSQFGWVVFEETKQAEEALEILDKVGDYELMPRLNQDIPSRPSLIPAEAKEPSRLEKDLSNLIELSRAMDQEAEISEGHELVLQRLEQSIKPQEDDESNAKHVLLLADFKLKKKVDMLILYLRHVHFFDYYSFVEALGPEDLGKRCAGSLRMVKADRSGPNKSTQFFAALDSKVHVRCTKPDQGQEIIRIGGQDVEIEIEKFMNKNFQKEGEGKFRCLVCSKLFKGDEYVKKHIAGKHTDLLDTVKANVAFSNAYVRDFGRVMPERRDRERGERPFKKPRHSFPGHSGGFSRPIEARRSQQLDPRGLRSYVDLDAPTDKSIEISYD